MRVPAAALLAGLLALPARAADNIWREAEAYDRAAGTAAGDYCGAGGFSKGKHLLSPDAAGAAWAEYDLDFPADGSYQLWVRYAAMDSRPLKASLDGKALPATPSAAATGGWCGAEAKWRKLAAVSVPVGGRRILKLEPGGEYWPHLDVLLLTPSADFVPPDAWAAGDSFGGGLPASLAAASAGGGAAPAALAPAAADPAFTLRAAYVFPNPARGGQRPTFRLQAGLADSGEVSIYDSAGRLVSRAGLGSPRVLDDGNGAGPQYTFEYSWDVSGTGSGVYTCILTATKSGSGDLRKVVKAAVLK